MFSPRGERCMFSSSGRALSYLVWILAGATASAGAGAVVIWKVRQSRAAEEEARVRAAAALGEGRALFRDGNYEGSIAKLEEALELRPELTEASQLLVRAREQLRIHEDARQKQEADRKKREEKRKKEIREHDYQLKMARMMLDFGQLDEATKAMRRALDLVPGSPEAIKLLEEIEEKKAKLARSHDDEQRRKELEAERRRHELARRRMTHDLALKTARLMFERGDLKGAKDLATEALEHIPDSPEATKLLAEVEKKLIEDRQHKREAAEEARLARERARVHHDVSLAAAEEALKEGAHNLARRYVEEALEADPESEEARALEKRIEKTERAAKERAEKEEFERALKKAEHDGKLKAARGFLKAGDFEAAKKLALQALEALPESVEARKLFDEASLREKEAVSAAEAERKREHDSAVARARSELAAGKLDAAHAQAQRALKLIPGSMEAREVLKEIASAKAAAARKREEPEKSGRLLEISRAFLDRSLLDGAEYYARKVLREDPQSGAAFALLNEVSSKRSKLEQKKLREELERERKASEEKLQGMIRKMEEEKEQARKRLEESLQRSDEERRKAREELVRKAEELRGLKDDLEKLIRDAHRREVAPVAVINVGSQGIGSDQVATLVAKGYERLGKNDLDGAEVAGKAALQLRPGYEPAETLLAEVRKRRAPAPVPVPVVEPEPSGEILARLDRALQDEDIDAFSKLLGRTLAAREMTNAREFFSLASEIEIKRSTVTPFPSGLKSDWTISYVLEGERVSSALSTEYAVARAGGEERIVAVKDLR